jgi:hypothetical protein
MLGLPPFDDLLRHLPPIPSCRSREGRILRPGQEPRPTHRVRGTFVLGAPVDRAARRGPAVARRRRGHLGSGGGRSGAAGSARTQPRDVGRAGYRQGRGTRTRTRSAPRFHSAPALGTGSGPPRHRRGSSRRQVAAPGLAPNGPERENEPPGLACGQGLERRALRTRRARRRGRRVSRRGRGRRRGGRRRRRRGSRARARARAGAGRRRVRWTGALGEHVVDLRVG